MKEKFLRGQLRIIVKEMLPDLLKEQQYEALKEHVDLRLTEVEKYIKQTMDLMNQRQKDVLKYLVEAYAGKPEFIEEESTVDTQTDSK